MQKAKEIYENAYRQNGVGVHALLIPKGRQDIRFKAHTRFLDKSLKVSILDYGCGFGDLANFLETRGFSYEYCGIDMMDDFIIESKRLHYQNKKAKFVQINSCTDVNEDYDYTIISGTFNVKYFDDKEEHRDFVYATLKYLFEKTKIVLSVDFMTDHVDFIGENAYHQNPGELIEFVKDNLSRRFILDQSYMPYEYCLTVFKDQDILRPDNVFKN